MDFGWLRHCMRIGCFEIKVLDMLTNMNLVCDRRNSMSLVGNLMVVCSVYIKIWIQVRIASRNSKGSVSLK